MSPELQQYQQQASRQRLTTQEAQDLDAKIMKIRLSDRNIKMQEIIEEMGISKNQYLGSLHRLSRKKVLDNRLPPITRRSRLGRQDVSEYGIDNILKKYLDMNDGERICLSEMVLQLATFDDLSITLNKLAEHLDKLKNQGVNVPEILVFSEEADMSETPFSNPNNPSKDYFVKVETCGHKYCEDENVRDVIRYYGLGFNDDDICAMSLLTKSELEEMYKKLSNKNLLPARPDHLVFLDRTPGPTNSISKQNKRTR